MTALKSSSGFSVGSQTTPKIDVSSSQPLTNGTSSPINATGTTAASELTFKSTAIITSTTPEANLVIIYLIFYFTFKNIGLSVQDSFCSMSCVTKCCKRKRKSLKIKKCNIKKLSLIWIRHFSSRQMAQSKVKWWWNYPKSNITLQPFREIWPRT
jgi:hypothetical protein